MYTLLFNLIAQLVAYYTDILTGIETSSVFRWFMLMIELWYFTIYSNYLIMVTDSFCFANLIMICNIELFLMQNSWKTY